MPPTPDMFRRLRIALVTVINGDSVADIGLQAIMGRATKLVHTWKAMKADGPLPTIAYQLLAFQQNSQDNDTRDGKLRLAVFATSLEVAENIAARLEALITHARLIAADAQLDCAPTSVQRLYLNDATDEDDVVTNPAPARAIERVDVDIDLNITQAA